MADDGLINCVYSEPITEIRRSNRKGTSTMRRLLTNPQPKRQPITHYSPIAHNCGSLRNVDLGYRFAGEMSWTKDGWRPLV